MLLFTVNIEQNKNIYCYISKCFINMTNKLKDIDIINRSKLIQIILK